MEKEIKTSEIKDSIRTIYGRLWELLALYEKTGCFNNVPEGADEEDIRDYMGNRLLEVRKEVNRLFPGEKLLREKLLQIVDEAELFIGCYERSGVVKRWKKINPRILFFDCAFDIMEQCPVEYLEMQLGLSGLGLSCYPDKKIWEAKKQYFSKAKKKMENEKREYSETKAFQDEMLKTLELVFENDFYGYWREK